MEAYFFEDKKVLEWVDLVIEKLFTICLLDDEVTSEDFDEGSKTVYKIATLLQTISPLPSEALMEGLKQLIEQRLPEDKVMNHFPSFSDELNSMLRVGLKDILANQSSDLSENTNAIPASSKITLSGGREVNFNSVSNNAISNNKISMHEYYNSQIVSLENIDKFNLLINTDIKTNESNHCHVKEHSLAIDTIDSTMSKDLISSDILRNENAALDFDNDEGEILELKTVGAFSRPYYNYCNLQVENEFPFKKNENDNNIDEIKTEIKKGQHEENKENKRDCLKENHHSLNNPSLNNTYYKNSRIPDKALRLQNVLQQFYPNSKIYWNCSISKYIFLAQVQDLLIYITNLDDETDSIIQEMSNHGWRVLSCSENDLKFPRRLEREIRALLRVQKSQKKGLNL